MKIEIQNIGVTVWEPNGSFSLRRSGDMAGSMVDETYPLLEPVPPRGKLTWLIEPQTERMVVTDLYYQMYFGNIPFGEMIHAMVIQVLPGWRDDARQVRTWLQGKLDTWQKEYEQDTRSWVEKVIDRFIDSLRPNLAQGIRSLCWGDFGLGAVFWLVSRRRRK